MSDFDSLLGVLHTGAGAGVSHRELKLELQELRKRLEADFTLRTTVLQRELGQAHLLLHALIELCLRKGILLPDELESLKHELDARDGNLDGTYNPHDPEASYLGTPDATSAFLRRLAQQHQAEAAAPPGDGVSSSKLDTSADA